MIPAGYDPVTLNHWLWFKYQCHECSPADFQRLFENVIKRAKPEFLQIKACGNIGDRKCDGLLHADGTVFQVYSPDELKQSELKKKIREDCDGAAKHWKNMKNWVFVYNAWRGLPPDIPGVLDEQRQKHPKLTIDHISSDKLWEMVRELSLRQRTEILGAPAGYEHLFFGPSASENEIGQALEEGRFVLVQDLMSPINLRDAVAAMAPRRPFGAPLWVRPEVGNLPWTDAVAEQAGILDEAIQRSRELLPRFSVFSLAQIPLAIHLGFVLSDRVDVDCYQFDRERKTWRWPDNASDADLDIDVKGMPVKKVNKAGDVVVRVSLSAAIASDDTRMVAKGVFEIDLMVKKPDVMWLRSAAQLGVLGTKFREVLRGIRDNVPGCQRIHLFYAGPTGGAVVIGQQINPRMNPPVETYEYSRSCDPRYRHALTLQDYRGYRLVESVGQSQTKSSDVKTPVGMSGTLPGRSSSIVGSGSQNAGTAPLPGMKMKVAAVIQFIAGDRGGGLRSQIQIPREEKAIRDAVSLGRYRDSFEFAPSVLAASIDNVISCHRNRPWIIHLVGHGDERRMVLVRDRDPLVELMLLEPGQAETLFGNFPVRVRLIVFNTCHSLELARHLADKNVVDMTIGIEGQIPDDHAIRFATTFYRQLAEGLSIQAAFELAGLQLGDLGAASRPQLFHADGVAPESVVFANGGDG